MVCKMNGNLSMVNHDADGGRWGALQSLFDFWNINDDPNENGDFKSDQWNKMNITFCSLGKFNHCRSSWQYKATNLMRSEWHCDSNGITLFRLAIGRVLSQLVEELMIRHGDPNIVHVKKNKGIIFLMYCTIEKNNVEMMKQLILYGFHFKKFVNDCENEFGNTMFGNYQLCRKFDVVLNINQTNKRNENGLLIVLESTNTRLNFGEKYL